MEFLSRGDRLSSQEGLDLSGLEIMVTESSGLVQAPMAERPVVLPLNERELDASEPDSSFDARPPCL